MLCVFYKPEADRVLEIAHKLWLTCSDQPERYGSLGDPYWKKVSGCFAEAALCRWCGVPYTGNIGKKGAYDCGMYESRGSFLQNAHLILHPDDSDGARHMLGLVSHWPGGMVAVRLAGWILGVEGKIPAYWNTTKLLQPAWMVPQSRLQCVSMK